MAIILVYAIIYWFVQGKKTFTGVKETEDGDIAAAATAPTLATK